MAVVAVVVPVDSIKESVSAMGAGEAAKTPDAAETLPPTHPPIPQPGQGGREAAAAGDVQRADDAAGAGGALCHLILRQRGTLERSGLSATLSAT